MKQLLLCITLIGSGFSGQAQIEFTTKSKMIPILKSKNPTKNTPTTSKTTSKNWNIPTITAPNILKNSSSLFHKSVTPQTYQLGEKPSFSMEIKNDFVNPSAEVEARLNKKEDNNLGASVYRRNQNLGDFRTKAKSARILYRDAEFVDGDVIRVYLNDKIIQRGVVLDSRFQGFEIVLETGFNKIDFEALNQGSSGPNTAEFQVYDANGILISSSQWNLGTGFKATLVLTKE